MARVRRAIRVLPGGVSQTTRRQPPLAAGYEQFRLKRQGAFLSAKTLDHYDGMVLPFLRWLDAEGMHRFDHLDGRSGSAWRDSSMDPWIVGRSSRYRSSANTPRMDSPSPGGKCARR
jgi:hypothetical protein